MTTKHRVFTPAEANRTLPLVKRIVADILALGAQARELQESCRDAQERGDRMEELRTSIETLLLELEQIGCSYKDWSFDVGLVDFPGVIDGEPVWLCWRSDEPELAWYHGLQAGYVGRQRIPQELLD